MKTSDISPALIGVARRYLHSGDIQYDICPLCRSSNHSKTDLGGSWAWSITCEDCKVKYLLSHGDKMGGQADSIEVVRQ